MNLTNDDQAAIAQMVQRQVDSMTAEQCDLIKRLAQNNPSADSDTIYDTLVIEHGWDERAVGMAAVEMFLSEIH